MKLFLHTIIVVVSLYWFLESSVLSAPYLESSHVFPIAKQSQNACYFNSVNIAVEAKYGTKFRIQKVLKMMEFDGKTLATWEYKKKFADLTHIIVHEYTSKKDLIRLLDAWEPVLVSTEIILKSKKVVRHVSVAYSYDDTGIWVSDPLWWKRKEISWNEVFWKTWQVKYYNLRTISIKPYEKWNQISKEREKKDDIWIDEALLK
jgi:hypothetical protein